MDNITEEIKKYKLTSYSHGAGCGCKIPPSVLDEILKQEISQSYFPNLLVGNDERDDAAVLDLGDGTAIVSSTDFFMPIVDDPEDFGHIASVNAISDIYAMGGTPLMAIAILGWPIKEIPPSVANQVMEGSRKACLEAGIPLAGGHSIDSPEPIFGLAVTGRVKIAQLKKNNSAKVDNKLFLTKPLGVGILTTAQKKQKLKDAHHMIARDSMMVLNKSGEVFGAKPYIKAMTDITGFGLLGHLSEMCEASNVSAVIEFEKVPLLDKDVLDYYLTENCIPGGTKRNWESYGEKVGSISDYQKHLLADPQTSGGLLVSVDANHEMDFELLAREQGLELTAFGYLIPKKEKCIYIQ